MATPAALVRVRVRQGVLELREGGPGLQAVYVRDSTAHDDMLLLETSLSVDLALPMLQVTITALEAMVSSTAVPRSL